MSNQFRHSAVDETSASERELTITAAPKAKVDIVVRLQFESCATRTKFTLPRSRVRALHHWLGEWLAATEGQDE